MTVWSPATYLAFAAERSRPFMDLLERVTPHEDPRLVVDLGCGPGELTAGLADRWPTTEVLGIDSSPEMIQKAQDYNSPRVAFRVQDLMDWQPDSTVDVIVSNATLQWVPRHRELLPRFIEALSTSGWLAFQVPGNFAEQNHRLLHDLAADPRFAPFTRDVERPAAFDAASYLDDLSALGCQVDAWETSYLHVLSGPDPVFRWISGTGARPVLQALPAELRAEFEREYRAKLRDAYPSRPYGTVLPYRRIFVVAKRIDEA